MVWWVLSYHSPIGYIYIYIYIKYVRRVMSYATRMFCHTLFITIEHQKKFEKWWA